MANSKERKAYLLDTNMVDLFFRIENGMDITGNFTTWEEEQKQEFETIMRSAYKVFKGGLADFYITETVEEELGYYQNKYLRQQRDAFVKHYFTGNNRVCRLSPKERKAASFLVSSVYTNPNTGYEIQYADKKERLAASLFDTQKSKGKDGRKDFCDATIYVESILGRTNEGKSFDGLVTFNNLDFIYNANHLMADGSRSAVNLRQAIVQTTEIASQDEALQARVVGFAFAKAISNQTPPLRPFEMVAQTLFGGTVDFNKKAGEAGKSGQRNAYIQNDDGSIDRYSVEANGGLAVTHVRASLKSNTPVKNGHASFIGKTTPSVQESSAQAPELPNMEDPQSESGVGGFLSPNAGAEVVDSQDSPTA